VTEAVNVATALVSFLDRWKRQAGDAGACAGAGQEADGDDGEASAVSSWFEKAYEFLQLAPKSVRTTLELSLSQSASASASAHGAGPGTGDGSDDGEKEFHPELEDEDGAAASAGAENLASSSASGTGGEVAEPEDD